MKNSNHTAQLIVKSDRETIKKIYDKNFPKILSYILKNNGYRSDAEDIFQQGFMLLYEHLKKDTSSVSSVNGYLFSICRNLWRSQKKANLRVTNQLIDTRLVETDTVEEKSKLEDQYQLYNEKMEELSENCRKLLKAKMSGIAYTKLTLQFKYNSETVTRQRIFKCKKKLIEIIQSDTRYKEMFK